MKAAATAGISSAIRTISQDLIVILSVVCVTPSLKMVEDFNSAKVTKTTKKNILSKETGLVKGDVAVFF